jgi:outer membrane protein TolC
MMKHVVLAALLFGASVAYAQPAAPQTITLQKALDLAQQQQPTLKQTQAVAEAAKGRVDLARVAWHPTLGLAATAGASSRAERSSAFGTCDPTVMTCSTGGFFTSQYSTGLSATLNWRIWDFGQTSANIRAAELNADAAVAGINTTKLDIGSGVATAYFEAVARRKLVVVAETTVKSEENHLDQARKFVAAQAKDPIEVAQAQARAANAKSALAQAQSDEATALATLRAAIGWVDPSSSFVVDPNWPEPPANEPAALGAMVAEAREKRPEILQLDKQIAAAEASVDAARAERRPVLSASAQAQYDPSSNDWRPEPSWVAGITLSWLAFDGGKSAADTRIAHANLMSSQAQRDALLVSLTSQLDAARATVTAQRANVSASNEAVSAAKSQLKLAEARYAQGLGSQIELADAQTAVTTANGNLISAEFQLANAWVQLRRQLGEL